ncbi:hypothetical protein CHUAL_002621 [Chamberlinius hualienensis]
MTELRRRTADDDSISDAKDTAESELERKDFDSEEEKLPEEKFVEKLAKQNALATDKTSEALEQALSYIPQRWRNWVIRGIFTILMIAGFFVIIWLGPLALIFITLAVQVKCFQEIISIGYAVYRVHGLPWFRSLSWYFLLTSNYFIYGESMVDYFGILFHQTTFFQPFITYHRFISFSMYIIGFVWFVLSLVKKYYMRQFSLFAWTHVTLLIVVIQSYLIMQNMFEGLIWFIIPVSMIICNDVGAYIFGFFFGKTPLIKLSPKKTWEGFIGGGFATIIFGLLASHFLCHYKYFVCPLEYSEEHQGLSFNCEPSPLFRATEYTFPIFMRAFFSMFGFSSTITLYPFVLHSLSLSVFSSVIGPFGGFFASGFKRAFKIKDFGDVIPGHGGIMDRFDCQFLMATFVNVYITSFIRTPSPQKLLQQVYALKPDLQLQLFISLKDSLASRGLLTP